MKKKSKPNYMKRILAANSEHECRGTRAPITFASNITFDDVLNSYIENLNLYDTDQFTRMAAEVLRITDREEYALRMARLLEYCVKFNEDPDKVKVRLRKLANFE